MVKSEILSRLHVLSGTLAELQAELDDYNRMSSEPLIVISA